MGNHNGDIRYSVKGMTCSGCESRIEKRLLGVDGVSKAKANSSGGFVDITYSGAEVDMQVIKDELSKIGYDLGTYEIAKGRGRLTSREFMGIAIVIFALYTVVDKTVGFNMIPEVSPSASFAALFVTGLITSLHCTVMCGGIGISQCMPKQGVQLGAPKSRCAPSIMYNIGRVASYTLIGGMVGYFGSVVSFSGYAKGIVAIMSGAFMVLMGMNMTGAFPWISRIIPKMPRILREKVDAASGKGPFYVGLLNGLMPCGPLQAMQLYALGTGSLIAGAGSMFFFSLGTVPLMFLLGAVSTHLGSRFSKNMTRAGAVMIVFLGVAMLTRGLALSGIGIGASNSYAAENTSRSSVTSDSGPAPSVAAVKDGKQTVETSLYGGGYPEITVQKGVPLVWTIRAEASDINGCNGTMVIPDLGIEKKFEPGDNLIEFTPEKTGSIPYSCWMGMIRSRINVVGDIGNIASEPKGKVSPIPATSPFPAGGAVPSCCQQGSPAER